jgi:hypothetical protein
MLYYLAIGLVLLILVSLYVQTYREGYVNIRSNVNNGEGLSKRYLLQSLRLLNENVRDIQIVKKTDTSSQENTAILKINGKENGKVSDVMNNMLKNVDYINFTMRNPYYTYRRNRRNRRNRR